MTPTEAATALLRLMPQPPTAIQLEEYGLSVPASDLPILSRELLSLNLYWVFAAIDAHVPSRYRTAIRTSLLQAIRSTWWSTGHIGEGSWDDYLKEMADRCAHYAYLVDYEGMSHMAVSAEAASLLEDRGFVISEEDRNKLLVFLIDYAPAAQYGKLLEEAG
ncbi:MAG: hypothetical protein NNA23_07705 [Nitrospira sp.]|nr:hypothetical protein [Nitrospira sp.]MCP9464800.1 hypothetical protein [Nitrospira sp.]